MNFYGNKLKLYLILFFHNLVPAYTIERLFWRERGMNVQMVVWSEIIYAATIICLEFPSGLLADRFGRKNLIVVSAFLSLVDMTIITFAHHFWQFAIAVFIAGISTALTSGASNALLYDSLASSGKVDSFEQTLGRMRAVDYIAVIIAALSGGFIAAKWNMEFNYFLSIFSFAIAFGVSCTLREPPRISPPEQENTIINIMRTAVSFLTSHIGVMKLLLNAVIVAACITYVYEFWQLYLEGFAFPVALFGVVSAALSIIVIPSSLVSGMLLKHFNHKHIILCASLLCGGGMLFAAVTRTPIGIVGLSLAYCGAAIIYPVAFGHLHRYADDNARATIESAVSLTERLISVVVGLLFAYISTRSDVNVGFAVLGWLVIIATICFAFAYRFDTETDRNTR